MSKVSNVQKHKIKKLVRQYGVRGLKNLDREDNGTQFTFQDEKNKWYSIDLLKHKIYQL